MGHRWKKAAKKAYRKFHRHVHREGCVTLDPRPCPVAAELRKKWHKTIRKVKGKP